MSDNGFSSAPKRYMTGGRETVDRMRDRCREFIRTLQPTQPAPYQRVMGDLVFAMACETHALKYDDRAGAKGDPAGDEEKARWWRQMANHALGHADDPRSDRPGFTPYVEQRGGG